MFQNHIAYHKTHTSISLYVKESYWYVALRLVNRFTGLMDYYDLLLLELLCVEPVFKLRRCPKASSTKRAAGVARKVDERAKSRGKEHFALLYQFIYYFHLMHCTNILLFYVQ